MIRNTVHPSLTAAVEQTPPFDKALYLEGRARQSSTAKRSDTTQSSQHPITNSPHNEHSGWRSDHEDDPFRALLMGSVEKPVIRSRSGRGSKGGPDGVETRQTTYPCLDCPVFSRSPLNGGWGALLICLTKMGKI